MALIYLNQQAFEMLKKLKRPGQSFSGVIIENLGGRINEGERKQ